MKQLPIKRLFQDRDSLDCGPVTTQMVLEYYGIKKPIGELTKNLLYTNIGTYLYDNGLLLLKEGLSVQLVTANSILFSGNDRLRLNNKESVKKHLVNLLTKKSLAKHQKTIQLFIDFIDAGGEVLIAIPQFEHIKNAIDENKLVMPIIHLNALGTLDGHDMDFHMMAVNGYDAEHVYFEDPYPDVKVNKASIEDFMFALHASTCGDIDNGSFLIVGK